MDIIDGLKYNSILIFLSLNRQTVSWLAMCTGISLMLMRWLPRQSMWGPAPSAHGLLSLRHKSTLLTLEGASIQKQKVQFWMISNFKKNSSVVSEKLAENKVIYFSFGQHEVGRALPQLVLCFYYLYVLKVKISLKFSYILLTIAL